jgi:hypothetical protein
MKKTVNSAPSMNAKRAKRSFLGTLGLSLIALASFGQSFNESMGTVGGTTAISTHESNNGFDNDAFTMTGNADVRVTDASTGYTGASGAANIFFTASGRSFQIEGINTSSLTGLSLSFGLRKSTNASNGSDFTVAISTDGVNYTPLSFSALPTGSGTSHWYLINAVGTIPSAANLRIRFATTGSSAQYRVDDVILSGGPCSASITPDGPTTLCFGGSVNLTANSGDSYLWSTGATTQSINVASSGTFSVQVTTSGCNAVSSLTRVLVYPIPSTAATAVEDTICPGDSSTLTARSFTNDLIFSEYVEGSNLEKYVEIYNGTGDDIDLSDYKYQAFHNGAVVPNYEIALSGILADGAVLILKNDSGHVYTGPDTLDSPNILHNGNDALGLFKISTASYVDIFGVIGQNPGAAWTGTGGYSTHDHTLRRKSTVYSGITVNPALPGVGGFSTLTTEWDLFPQDDVSGLGSHSIDAATYSWASGTVPSTGKIVKAGPTTTTTYTLTGTFVNGCENGLSTVIVNIGEDCGGGERKMSGIAADKISDKQYSLSAFPNPFSSAVNIQLNAAEAGHAKVSVKDMTGRIVAILLDENVKEGSTVLSWTPAGNISNGVYVCEVTTNSGVRQVKLIVSGK